MDIQYQIAVVTQKQQELLKQAEHARLVRQLREGRLNALAHGYAAARKALRGRRMELDEPIPIPTGVESQAAAPHEQDGPIAA